MRDKRPASKASGQAINPLFAPELYAQHFGGNHKNTVTVPNPGNPPFVFRRISTLSDNATGFRADVMLDARTGHAVILYKGMDVPFRDEGAGRLGFLRDIFTAVSAKLHGGCNNQMIFADRIYRRTMANSRVKSLEVVGFSLGSLHANYIAAKYGVKATVMSDLGLGPKELKEPFDRAAVEKNVTVLRMDMDLIPYIAKAGPSLGSVIDLDKGHFPAWSGLTHKAKAYGDSASKRTPPAGPSPA